MILQHVNISAIFLLVEHKSVVQICLLYHNFEKKASKRKNDNFEDFYYILSCCSMDSKFFSKFHERHSKVLTFSFKMYFCLFHFCDQFSINIFIFSIKYAEEMDCYSFYKYIKICIKYV